jgi:alpha-beta hydrolase superfamily lysophospholipase
MAGTSGRTGTARLPARGLLLRTLAAACVLLLAGCVPGVDRRIVEGAVEEWEAPALYELPDPIPAGSPGDIYRSEKLTSTMDGTVAWRILYHSTDLNGENILVSGTVVAPANTAPSGAAPSGGRPVVSWAHPTTGTAPRCAPSAGLDPFDLIEGLRGLIEQGYVVASTDYPGLGADGPDSYLVGVSEGNSVIDAARAARTIPETGANGELLLWGHSQGGQAALFAAQSVAQYAPELTLKAVAVAAPATDLGQLLDDDLDDISGVTISSYALTAYSEVYPQAALDTILTPAGVKATPGMNALCLLGQNRAIHTIARPLIGEYFSGDPTQVEPWATLLTENSPGAVALTVPLFIAQGETDTLVDPKTTSAFADHECAIGTRVTYVPLPKTGHGLAALRALDTLMPWFAQVQRGETVTSTCAE